MGWGFEGHALSVIPAQAGIHRDRDRDRGRACTDMARLLPQWIPACAGMTFCEELADSPPSAKMS
ncbi:hypothetical protein D3874_15440 [Oleomonas cavernae]|uniref:Uncharacterized protein n=1 Tax=Oleomonas cavernae TaxID=2320859 RepID=A0A418WDY9_9PROT|nr:hypothetical protein D3874_15440 [Oleomonas cavernae]